MLVLAVEGVMEFPVSTVCYGEVLGFFLSGVNGAFIELLAGSLSHVPVSLSQDNCSASLGKPRVAEQLPL